VRRYSPDDDRDVAMACSSGQPSSTGWVRGQCPFCLAVIGTPGTTKALGLNLRTLRYKCFRCGTWGKLAKHPSEFELLDYNSEPEPESAPPLELPEGFVLMSSNSGRHSTALEPARKYLESRAMPEGVADEVGIGACARGMFAGRVIVPVRDAQSRLRWFVGRTWAKRASKPYMYPKGARAGLMFNEHILDAETDVPALVVEGCFDALALWPNAIAVLGKTTDPQLLRLSEARRPVVLVGDGDAHEEGWANALRLRVMGAKAAAVWLPPKVDPDECEPSQIWDAAYQALEESSFA